MSALRYAILTWGWNLLIEKSVEAGARMNVEDPVVKLVVRHGYPLEIYNDVITSDGYLLTIYRIPYGKNASAATIRIPALLVHGLFGNSGNFLCLGPNRGLGFLLADRMYDVWILNVRGTTQSRKHVSLNPDTDAQYWQFSWHEIGMHDLPVTFDLIRNVTKQQKLIYVGLSQGTTAFFVLASETPAINEMVSVMIALAPAAYTKYFNGPLAIFLAAFEPMLTQLARITGIHELLPQSIMTPLRMFIAALCNMNILREVCYAVASIVAGPGSTQLDKESISTALSTTISGIAIRQVLHFAQNVNSGEFRKYNYGVKENMRRYGSKDPPIYNISKITAPVALYYAENDWLTHYKDVEDLCKQLPNCIYKYKVPDKRFNHFDFVMALDLVKLVFEDMFKFLKEYRRNFE